MATDINDLRGALTHCQTILPKLPKVNQPALQTIITSLQKLITTLGG